jgi:hypothetical protein
MGIIYGIPEVAKSSGTATITVNDSSDPVKIATLTIATGTVRSYTPPPPAYSISVSALKPFAPVVEGYLTLPDAQTVTIRNTGTKAVTGLALDMSGAPSFEIVDQLSATEIAPRGKATFSVQPKAGLTAEQYTGQITVTGDNDVNVTFIVYFNVTAVPVTIIAQGDAGARAGWVLYSDGLLEINGTGAMKDFESSGSDRPWNDYSTTINKVLITDGITTVGKNAFRNFPALEEVTLGDAIHVIDQDAFNGCSSLEAIILPPSVGHIVYGAFYGCPALREVICEATTAPILYINNFTANTVDELIIIEGSTGYTGYWEEVFTTISVITL